MSRALDELGHMAEEQQDLRDETYKNGQGERHRQREERGQLGLPGEPTLNDFFGQGGVDGVGGEGDSGRPNGLAVLGDDEAAGLSAGGVSQGQKRRDG